MAAVSKNHFFRKAAYSSLLLLPPSPKSSNKKPNTAANSQFQPRSLQNYPPTLRCCNFGQYLGFLFLWREGEGVGEEGKGRGRGVVVWWFGPCVYVTCLSMPHNACN